MTEEQWLGSTDPQKMLQSLKKWGRASNRKLRLFAVACCRRVLWRIPSRHKPTEVEVLDRYADGLAKDGERQAIHDGRRSPVISRAASADAAEAARSAAKAAASLATCDLGVETTDLAWTVGVAGEEGDQAALLRDLFGPLPFREVRIDPAWLAWNDGLVRRLAEELYEGPSLPDGHLDASRMGVLGDALEDARCDDSDILNHCRQPSVHVHGCYVIDLLLGKE